MIVRYSANNSGGGWWLDDDDWHALARAGWTVHWLPNRGQDCGLGRPTLATSAEKAFSSEETARAEWAAVLPNQDPNEEGCPCCGPPHHFSEKWESHS